jgi:hypothetical protein
MNRSRSFLALIVLLLIPVLVGASPVDGPERLASSLQSARHHLMEAQRLCRPGQTPSEADQAGKEMQQAQALLTSLAPDLPSHRLDRLVDVIGKAFFCLVNDHDAVSATAYLHGPIRTLESFEKEVVFAGRAYADDLAAASRQGLPADGLMLSRSSLSGSPMSEIDRKFELVNRQPGVPHSDRLTGGEFEAEGKRWRVGQFNIDWRETQAWITKQGLGWRAPTHEELRALFKALGGKPHFYKLSQTGPGVKHLGADTLWAQERTEDSAWCFECYTGTKHWLRKQRRSIDSRAIAVQGR